MPRIEAAHLDAMIAVFASEAGAAIVVPTHEGQRGNPVLWPAELFGEMLALEGDVGARSPQPSTPCRCARSTSARTRC